MTPSTTRRILALLSKLDGTVCEVIPMDMAIWNANSSPLRKGYVAASYRWMVVEKSEGHCSVSKFKTKKEAEAHVLSLAIRVLQQVKSQSAMTGSPYGLDAGYMAQMGIRSRGFYSNVKGQLAKYSGN